MWFSPFLHGFLCQGDSRDWVGGVYMPNCVFPDLQKKILLNWQTSHYAIIQMWSTFHLSLIIDCSSLFRDFASLFHYSLSALFILYWDCGSGVGSWLKASSFQIWFSCSLIKKKREREMTVARSRYIGRRRDWGIVLHWDSSKCFCLVLGDQCLRGGTERQRQERWALVSAPLTDWQPRFRVSTMAWTKGSNEVKWTAFLGTDGPVVWKSKRGGGTKRETDEDTVKGKSNENK